MKRLFCKKEINVSTKLNPKNLRPFYQMLLKIQKKRNNLNLDRLMKALYGNNFRNFLK